MPIKHLFVLMLENRSFDHLLGFADLRGRDAESGHATHADDLVQLQGTARWAWTANLHPNGGPPFLPSTGAAWKIYAPLAGPGHEFTDVLEQLCGPGASVPAGGGYPPITGNGFATNYARRCPRDPGLPLRSFAPDRVPVLTALAREFAVCDRWFSSLPGPTWPNRFFVHAATSGGLDDSPSPFSIGRHEVGPGYAFAHGTIFDRLGGEWMVLHGDAFPHVFSLRGMADDRLRHRFRRLRHLPAILDDPRFSARYVFIEPSYGRVYSDYARGSSQHPLDDVTAGEALIKFVYDVVRQSRRWQESALVVTYDEHGGFFDHVAPPEAVPPGDAPTIRSGEHHGFDFRRLGVRVPAVVASPLIPRGTIDHRVYDHASIPATLTALFDLPSRDGRRHLTDRAAATGTFESLFDLPRPRTDTPAALPAPAVSGYDPDADRNGDLLPDGEIDPQVWAFLHVAFLRRYGLTPAMIDRSPQVQRFLRISTRVQARQFFETVERELADGG